MKMLKDVYVSKDGVKCYAVKLFADIAMYVYYELRNINKEVSIDGNTILIPQNQDGILLKASPGNWIVVSEGNIQIYNDKEFNSTFCKIDKFIQIKYFSDEIERLKYIDGKSDWIDLRSAAEINMKAGEFKLIPLGVAMQLPEGYEAHVVPRSSTFKNYGIIQTNSMGIIDETFCGDEDQWFLPAYALRDTKIHINDRICQFRIMEHQPTLMFDEVTVLENDNRGGHGSTGKQ